MFLKRQIPDPVCKTRFTGKISSRSPNEFASAKKKKKKRENSCDSKPWGRQKQHCYCLDTTSAQRGSVSATTNTHTQFCVCVSHTPLLLLAPSSHLFAISHSLQQCQHPLTHLKGTNFKWMKVPELKKKGEPEETSHKEKERKIRRHRESFSSSQAVSLWFTDNLPGSPATCTSNWFDGVLTIGHCLKLHLRSSVWPFCQVTAV